MLLVWPCEMSGEGNVCICTVYEIFLLHSCKAKQLRQNYCYYYYYNNNNGNKKKVMSALCNSCLDDVIIDYKPYGRLIESIHVLLCSA